MAWNPALFNNPGDSAFAGELQAELSKLMSTQGGNQSQWEQALQQTIATHQAQFGQGWGGQSNPYVAAQTTGQNFSTLFGGAAPTLDQGLANQWATTVEARDIEKRARDNDDDDWFSSLLPIAGLALGGYGLLSGLGGLGAGAGAFGAAEEAAMLGGGLGSMAPIAPSLGSLSSGFGSQLTGGNIGLTGGSPNFGFDPVNGITPSGGSMPFDFGSYDPSNPFGFGGADPTMPGGISEPFTGMGGTASTPFAGYDFGLGYPVGGDVASSGASSILTELAKKVGPTAAKSVFSKWLENPTDMSTIGSLLGAAAPGLISEYFKSNQADKLSAEYGRIADRENANRQPFLDYAKSTLAGGPDAYAAGAGSQALKRVLAKLSAGFGNPIGAPAALGIATDSALNNWGNDWRQAANIGLGGNYSQLATNAATAGAPSGGAGYGDAAASVFSPQKSLSDLMKSLQQAGLA